jgi:uncharacterized protein YdhG (YjbR/CyaY superfamily)
MSVIDDYLVDVSPEHRAKLQEIRTLIQKTVPETSETISYGIPTLDYKGKHLIHFAAFKDHLSLFPGALSPELQEEVKDFKLSKGTIQFIVEHPIPDDVIIDIAITRKQEIDQQ